MSPMSSQLSSKSSPKSESNARSNSLAKPGLAPAAVQGRGVALIRSLFFVLALLGAVAPAQALSVDVFFDGTRPASHPDNAYGISLASALNARDNFGVPILDSVDLLTSVTGRLSVIQPPSSELVIDPSPPTSSLNTVLSNWQVENVSGSAMLGASYLLFTHTGPYQVGSTTIDYPDEKVGLRIDAAQGWVIIRGQSLGVDYYYPALLLDRSVTNPIDGNIAAGERVSAGIHYVVSQALVGIKNNGTTSYYLPELRLGYALVVVPEPGTALLFGVGLVLLAAQRKNA